MFQIWGNPGPKKIEIKTHDNDNNQQKFKNNYSDREKMHRAPEDRFARAPKRRAPAMEEVWGLKVYLSLVPRSNIYIYIYLYIKPP